MRPDGSTIALSTGEFLVDKAGVWKVVAKKEGYRDAETETAISETSAKPAPSGDLGQQVARAVENMATFVTESPVRFALLLTTIIGLIGAGLFLKRRRKGKVEKI